MVSENDDGKREGTEQMFYSNQSTPLTVRHLHLNHSSFDSILLVDETAIRYLVERYADGCS